MYLHLEKQELEFCCGYIVQIILVTQVKWSIAMKVLVILAFS